MKEEYSNQYRRWYDKDPILQRSMQTLENSDDESQIKIALNLIKIIIEHNISNEEYTPELKKDRYYIFIGSNGVALGNSSHILSGKIFSGK